MKWRATFVWLIVLTTAIALLCVQNYKRGAEIERQRQMWSMQVQLNELNELSLKGLEQ